MKFLILGDVHVEWNIANKVIENALQAHPDITHIIQVGDLGDGWPGEPLWNPTTANELPIHWLDGNHENFTKITENDFNPRLIYQPRGSVLEVEGKRILFMGGATSIDKDRRTPGLSWWPEESIATEDLDRALSHEGPIDVVFSHDRPISAPMPEDFYLLPCGFNDRFALEQIYQKYKPKFWFFGHYHFHYLEKVNDTTFCLCPIIDDEKYVIWDGVTVSVLI